MTVTVNKKVEKWIAKQQPLIQNRYDEYLVELRKGDLGRWRHVGKSNNIYDKELSGDLRLVGELSGDKFYVKAVYKHKETRGKELVAGDKVDNYTK